MCHNDAYIELAKAQWDTTHTEQTVKMKAAIKHKPVQDNALQIPHVIAGKIF